MYKVSDESIVNELEYRGIDDFLSEMEDGLVVPSPFVERVKSIVKENYDIDLVAKPSIHTGVHSGEYCSMFYIGTSVTLVSSYE